MNLLYAGRYQKRFAPVMDQLADLKAGTRVLELCFGDTRIAAFCLARGLRWQGIDINPQFVSHAQKAGFDAKLMDLDSVAHLPEAEVCIMMGSLYHFHPQAGKMLKQMTDASPVVILSEPVRNLSSEPGIIGWLAKKAADAGKGKEEFRFTENSFLAMIRENAQLADYSIALIQPQGKDLLVKLIKHGESRN